jgi:hypothetical protein
MIIMISCLVNSAILLISTDEIVKAQDSTISYRFTGTLEPLSASYHYIDNVKKNDLVLVSINSSASGHDVGYNSVIFLGNSTVYQSKFSDLMGNYPSNPHIYRFNAPIEGPYYLAVFLSSSTMEYTITSSHKINETKNLNANILTPYFGELITTTPTTPPITNTPIPQVLTADAGDTTTFRISSSVVSNDTDGKYVWDFGDGTVSITNGDLTTHVYQNPGKYAVVVKVQDSDGERIIQTYTITVNTKSTDPLDVLKIVIPVVTASITASVSLFVFFQKKKHKLGD